MRSTGVRLVTRPTARTVPTPRVYGDAVEPLPPYTAVVLAGGQGGPARRPGQAAAARSAGARCSPRCSTPSPTPTAPDRRRPAAAGPGRRRCWCASSRPAAGPSRRCGPASPRSSTDVVAVLAGDLPFLTARARRRAPRARLTGDGVLVVDDGGRDQYLLGVWRTAALRAAVAGAERPDLAAPRPRPARRRRLRTRWSSRARRPPWLTATPPPTWPGPAPSAGHRRTSRPTSRPHARRRSRRPSCRVS